MRSFKAFVIFLFFSKANNFLIPSRLIGAWRVLKMDTNIFHIDPSSIYALYNHGNISMDCQMIIENERSITIDLDHLCVHKIPKNIDYKNMMKALKIIGSLRKKGLRIMILDTQYENLKKIKYNSSDIVGEFEIKKDV